MYEVFFTKCCALSTKYIKIMKKPLALFATMKKLSTAIHTAATLRHFFLTLYKLMKMHFEFSLYIRIKKHINAFKL